MSVFELSVYEFPEDPPLDTVRNTASVALPLVLELLTVTVPE